jgi:argininosuccinate synthase
VTHAARERTRIVFACSGTAESLAAIPRLAETFDADVVALTLDVGQSRELEGIRQAALAAGAVRAHVVDAREEFARHCIACSFEGTTPTARPLVARKLVEIARIEGAAAIAHGGTDVDHAEIETRAREQQWLQRVIAIHGDGGDSSVGEPTLWERSPRKTDPSGDPARLEIVFEDGLPVSVNGVPMTLTELIESVATIADAPAAVIFRAAHEALGRHASHAVDATVCLELCKGQHRVVSANHS